jgi:hypothetical protein
MIGDNTLDKINSIFEEKIFKFTAPLFSGGPDSKLDIKLKFLGYRKMISVGEYYDYLRVVVTIVGVNDEVTSWFFHNDIPTHRDFWQRNRWYFMSQLNMFISKLMRAFTTEDVRVVIEEVIVDLNKVKPETIKEQKMSKVAIRTLVRDLTRILKSKKEGYYYLPDEEGGEYSFSNLGFTFSCEFEVIFDNTLKGFLVNADYSPDDDVVELVIKVNPDNVISQMYDIIGELNEVVAHELEHGRQHFKGEIEGEKKIDSSFDYYAQIKEIKSQRVGFRRLSKLTGKPVNEIAENWFKTHKEIHGLSDEEIKKVLSLILN